MRIGIVVDGLSVPSWQAAIVAAVGAEPGFERAVLVVGTGPRPRHAPHPIVVAHDAFDRLLDRGRNQLLTPASLELAGAPVVEWTPGGSAIAPDVLDRFRERNLDVLVDLCSGAPPPDLSAAARCGVWSLRFGTDRRRDGELVGLAEAAEPGALHTATLEVTESDGRPRVVGRTTCGSHPYSPLRTRNVLAAAAVNLLLGRLRSVRELGPGVLTRLARNDEPLRTSAKRSPNGFQLAGTATGLVFRVARRLVEKAVRDDFFWSVAIARRPPGAGLDALIRDAVFREIPQRADWFLADPILAEHDGEQVVFMEAFPYRTGRGVIAVSRIDSAGACSDPQIVLERPYHLSYPFVFTWRETTFMIPETSAHRTVELYRCERFPDRWELDRVLLDDVEAADATIVPYAGRLWMFVVQASRGLWLDTELHVYFADDIRGPWRAHPLNPVVSDVRCARPAGPVWEENGRLIRPGQDCRLGHAEAVSFQAITTLTAEDYAEEPLERLTVDQLPWKPNAERVHTWCMNSRYVAIDTTVSRWRLNLG